MPVEMRPAQIDFSALANLGQIPERLRMRGLRGQFASGAFMGPNGELNYPAMIQALGAVSPDEAARAAMNYAESQALGDYRNQTLSLQQQRLAQQPSMTPYQQRTLELREQEVGNKRAEKAQGAQQRRDVLVNEMARLKDTAGALAQHPGLSRSTGLRGQLMTVPGTDPANFEAQLDTLKSQIGFNVLQAMRNASQTGGALGQVAVQELVMLQNNLGALDTKQSPDAFAQQLQQIAAHAEQVISRLNQAAQIDAGEQPTSAPPQSGIVPRPVPTMNVSPDGSMSPTQAPVTTDEPPVMAGSAANPVSQGPRPLPRSKAALEVGQVYNFPDGRQGLWNGREFEVLN